MYACLRIDLDYVPWDTPDAAEYGHGEPAAFLRLLEFARGRSYRFHFFASERVLRAFAPEAEAVLNEGHDLDWLCKHPESTDRKAEALRLFENLGHVPWGLAVKGSWPATGAPGLLEGFRFISAAAGRAPEGIRHFPVETRAARDAFRSGTSVRTWIEGIRSQIREYASRNLGLTIAIRPQVLAKHDPHLILIRETIELAEAVGLEIKTLRQVL